MTNPFITNVNPMQQLMIDPEAQALQRQKQYAAMLMQQNQMPQGQVIGGHYVAPSWTQQLNAALNPIIGAYMMNQSDKEQEKLAEKSRRETAQGLIEYNRLRYGQQGTPDIVPQGQTLRDDEGNLTYGSQAGIASVEANPAAAYAYALQNKSPIVNQMAMEMLKPQKLGEGERIVTFNPNTGKEEVVMQGGEKYHAPISVDTGTGTVLLDPKTMKPIAQYGKTTSGHVLETDNGPMLVDTRTGKATPITAGGQQVTGGKPLTDSQGQATGFGIRAAESDKILSSLENQGVTSTGKFRSGVSGIVGGVPLIGEKLESGTYNAMNMLPGVLGGPNAQQQQTDQARRNFVTAVLRKESGASISPSEFANEEKKYFPQAGDSDAVIKQKQEARKLAIKSLEVQAGSGAKQIKEAVADQSDVAKSWLQANPNHPLAGQVKAKLKAEGKL